MTGKHGQLLERLARHYIPEPNSGCWLWTGSVTKYGYGQLSGGTGKNPLRAHVLAYTLYKGPIPKGLDVRHTCDVRCCVNPEHLLTGTRLQNMQDCESRGRLARGSALPHTRLAPEAVTAIILDQRTHKQIAVTYQVSPSYVSMLKSRKRRKILCS